MQVLWKQNRETFQRLILTISNMRDECAETTMLYHPNTAEVILALQCRVPSQHNGGLCYFGSCSISLHLSSCFSNLSRYCNSSWLHVLSVRWSSQRTCNRNGAYFDEWFNCNMKKLYIRVYLPNSALAWIMTNTKNNPRTC